MKNEFKLFKVKAEFFEIMDWEPYKVTVKDSRPTLILVIENKDFPYSMYCLPITSEKNGKWKRRNKKSPDLTHYVKFSKHESYILIQNFFFFKKRIFRRSLYYKGRSSRV